MPLLGELTRRAGKAFTINRLGTGTQPIEFSGVTGQIDHRGGPLTAAGVGMNEQAALRVAACWIAVTLLADEVSSLAMKIVRRDDQRRQPVKPAELSALWDRPNPDQTRMGITATECLSLTLWGNAYTMLGWTRGGALEVRWPIDPALVSLERIDGGVRLKSTGQGELVNRAGERPQFMHIPRYVMPGRMQSLSPVAMAADLLGLSAAYDRAAARLMGRGLNPTAVLTAGEPIAPDVSEELSKRFERMHGGSDNAGRVIVVGGKDIKLERMTMSMADAEFVAQRQDVFAVVMALWRVPPTVAGMVDKPSTWGTGVGEFARGLERFTLRPIVQLLQAGYEDAITKWVAGGELQVRFSFDSLLSAAPKDRAEIQRLSLMNGMTSVERVLAQNDEPPFGQEETLYTSLALATPEDQRLERMRRQAAAAAELIRAGVTPERALAVLGLDGQIIGAGT